MLRDVMRLAWARLNVDWAQTSHVMWMIYSVNRAENSPVKKPSDFNPLLSED